MVHIFLSVGFFTCCSFVSGGLTAVIYTDVLQCTIMILGAMALSVVGK